MKSKEKAIELAWIEEIGEENYTVLKSIIDVDNGMAPFRLVADYMSTKNLVSPEYGYLRPKSLQGIETNNGWTAILSEKDLPSDGNYYTILTFDKAIVEREYPHPKFSLEFNKEWWLKYVTHYQPIIKPQPPIY